MQRGRTCSLFCLLSCFVFNIQKRTVYLFQTQRLSSIDKRGNNETHGAAGRILLVAPGVLWWNGESQAGRALEEIPGGMGNPHPVWMPCTTRGLLPPWRGPSDPSTQKRHTHSCWCRLVLFYAAFPALNHCGSCIVVSGTHNCSSYNSKAKRTPIFVSVVMCEQAVSSQ